MSTSATDKKVIAITGASSGIGEETAKQLVNNGFNVALLARSEDKLRALVEELGNDNAFAVKADVSDFNELDKAFKQVSEHFGRIDGIFANAGRGAKAAGIEKGDVDDWDGMLGANVNGLLYTAKAGLPYLRDTQGHFIITSSVAGRIALKGSVYGASKWFAYGFGQNLAEEMREWGGRCTTTRCFGQKPGERLRVVAGCRSEAAFGRRSGQRLRSVAGRRSEVAFRQRSS